MKLRNYILCITLCPLLSFIAANRISYKAGGLEIIAFAQIQPPPLGRQCRACDFTPGCITPGVNAIESNTETIPCGSDPPVCQGNATIKPLPIISGGEGKSSIIQTFVPCKNSTGDTCN